MKTDTIKKTKPPKYTPPNLGEGISGAIFSEDRLYRYALWRIWDRSKPALVFIGFNPSTAREYRDDHTIIKLAAAAKRLNYGALYAGNMYALISKDPEAIYRNPALAIGIQNDVYLKALQSRGTVVLGWGNFASRSELTAARAKSVYKLLRGAATDLPPVNQVYCFKRTKQGQPQHPLYLPFDQAELVIY